MHNIVHGIDYNRAYFFQGRFREDSGLLILRENTLTSHQVPPSHRFFTLSYHIKNVYLYTSYKITIPHLHVHVCMLHVNMRSELCLFSSIRGSLSLGTFLSPSGFDT